MIFSHLNPTFVSFRMLYLAYLKLAWTPCTHVMWYFLCIIQSWKQNCAEVFTLVVEVSDNTIILNGVKMIDDFHLTPFCFSMSFFPRQWIFNASSYFDMWKLMMIGKRAYANQDFFMWEFFNFPPIFTFFFFPKVSYLTWFTG